MTRCNDTEHTWVQVDENTPEDENFSGLTCSTCHWKVTER